MGALGSEHAKNPPGFFRSGHAGSMRRKTRSCKQGLEPRGKKNG